MHDVRPHGGPIADRASVPVWVAKLAVLLKRRRRIESQRPPPAASSCQALRLRALRRALER